MSKKIYFEIEVADDVNEDGLLHYLIEMVDWSKRVGRVQLLKERP